MRGVTHAGCGGQIVPARGPAKDFKSEFAGWVLKCAKCKREVTTADIEPRGSVAVAFESS